MAAVNAGSFPSFYTEGSETHMEGIQDGKLNDLPVSYMLMQDTPDMRSWYRVGTVETNPSILKVFGVPVTLDNDQSLVFTELVEDTLHTWLNSHPPISQTGITMEFKRILRGILGGLLHLITRRPKLTHGNLNSHSVFVVDGDAKLGKFMDWGFGHGVGFEDIQSFRRLLRESLANKSVPLEFSMFCDFLDDRRKSKTDRQLIQNAFYCPSVSPVFLSGKQRRVYRYSAMHEMKSMGLLGSCMQDLLPKLPATSWIKNVQRAGGEYVNVLCHDPTTQTSHALVPQYLDVPREFWRYSRNLQEHVRDKGLSISDEDIDSMLESFYPGYMEKLHEVLIHHGVVIMVP